jgi:transcriptional regulator with XRE-family HTH domain
MMGTMETAIDLQLKCFSQRLKDLRTQRKLSQTELGERAQVNFSQVSRYERGAVHPTVDVLVRLAHALGVTVGDFFTATESPLPNDPEIVSRLQEMQGLPAEDKEVIKKLLDAFLMKKRFRDLASSS